VISPRGKPLLFGLICISQIKVAQFDSLPVAGVLCAIKQFCARYRHNFIAKSGYWSDGFVQPIPDKYTFWFNFPKRSLPWKNIHDIPVSSEYRPGGECLCADDDGLMLHRTHPSLPQDQRQEQV